MKECSNCHCKWVENDYTHHDACPLCGSVAVGDAFVPPSRTSLLLRMAIALIPSVIAVVILFVIVSTAPKGDDGRALEYVLVTYGIFAIATPILLLFWAADYFRYRLGSPPIGQKVTRTVWSVCLAGGMTFLNYCIAFAGCTASIFMTSY